MRRSIGEKGKKYLKTGKKVSVERLIIIFLFFVLFSSLTISTCKKRTQEPEDMKVIEKEEERRQSDKKIKELEISTIPRNRGFLRDLEQPLDVYFSERIEPQDFSFSISPDPGKWQVSWIRRGTAAVLEHSNPFQKGMTYTLKLNVSSFEKEKTVEFMVSGPSSLELIDKDEGEGLIDLDTAMTYRLQRLFEPSKLPEKYQSLTPVKCGTSVWKTFNRVKDELKPETLSKLRPYLVRPNHPDSVFNQKYSEAVQADSHKEGSSSGLLYAQTGKPKRPKNMFDKKDCSDKIRIWYRRGREHKAQRACYWINQKNMYDRFLQIMGKEPLSDSGECSSCGSIQDPKKKEQCLEETCGGDGKLDIYLVSPLEPGLDRDDGWCRAIGFGSTSSDFILINQRLQESPKNYFAAALAHEIFHAFQDAHDAGESEWWAEATAVWAEDYIGEEWNTERDYIPDAFLSSQNRLETLTNEGGAHPYGIYIFPFFLSHEIGDKIIGDIWNACAGSQALDAVKSKVNEFDKKFKKFAYTNSDIGPTEGMYMDVPDPLTLYEHHTEKKFHLDSSGTSSPLEIEVNLPPLSAKYYRIYNECDPDITPHILFDLKMLNLQEKISIQAIIDPDGDKIEEDWSEQEEREFCINKDEEKFDSIALIIASSEEKSVLYSQLNIEIDAKECVEADAEMELTTRWSHSYLHKDDDKNYSKDSSQWDAHTNIQYRLDWVHVDEDEVSEHYDVLSYDVLSVNGQSQVESMSSDKHSETFCQGKGVVVDWEIDKDPRKMVIIYDKRSGSVKQIELPVASILIDEELHGTCETTYFSNPPRTETEDMYDSPLPAMGLLTAAFPEIQKAKGDIRSKTISGGGTHLISHPKGPQKMTVNYTISIKRKSQK